MPAIPGLSPPGAGERVQLNSAGQAELHHPAPSATRRFYRPELDVLRFCCFLLVFIHHAGTERGKGSAILAAILGVGSLGVPVFFLLSSFLITELLLRERLRTSTVHIKAFYLRRVLRIWPLYFVFIALSCALGLAHLTAVQPVPGKMAVFYLLLAGNWYLIIYGIPSNALIVLWSISVEEQFYLLWPWLARLGGATAIAALALVMLPVSYLVLALLAHHGVSDAVIWPNTFVQMQFFAVGSVLALMLERWKPAFTPRGRAGLGVCTLAAWLVACSLCRLKQPDPQISIAHACFGYLLVGSGAVCMFLAFYGFDVGNGRLSRSLMYLGKISYGLYAFHYLALELVSPVIHHLLPGMHRWPLSAPFALLFTIACAACSYRFLETPALRLKEKFTFVQSRGV